MYFLAACLRDEELRDALEADFQDLGLDLRDLYRANSKLTLRRAICLANELNPDSRVMKHLRNDPYNREDHFLMTVVDHLRRIDFYSQVTARSTVGNEGSSVFDDTPEAMIRQKLRETPEEVAEQQKEETTFHFTKGRDLAANTDGEITTKKIRKQALAALRAQKAKEEFGEMPEEFGDLPVG